jgi:hypothetical protein
MFLRISGGYGRIIEQAKPHGLGPFSMVTRGPYQGKGVIQFSGMDHGYGFT